MEHHSTLELEERGESEILHDNPKHHETVLFQPWTFFVKVVELFFHSGHGHNSVTPHSFIYSYNC